MYLSYGSYVFPTGEASVVISKNARYSARGVLDTTVERWQITGTIIADGEYALTTAINALQAAFSVNNQNLVLHHSNGNWSSHYLSLAQAAGGIRVTDLDFPVGGRTQYATGRSYQITVEAEYPNLNGGILSYLETISFIGNGGPRYAYLETINGSPQRQTTSQQTLFRATQSGSAVGKGGYVPFPAPLWPAVEDGEARVQTYTGAELIGGVYTNFQTQWGYSFTSDVPLFGLPTIY